MKRKATWQNIFAVTFLLGLFFIAGVSQAKAVAVYAVTSSNQLVRFGAATPGTVTPVGTISGMQAGENVVGIDFRPATGQLYALGSNSRLYIINKSTAQATLVGTGFSVPLNGTNFGFDFNPVIDRIRIVSDADQNLVANPNDGTNTQVTPLFYANGDPNQGQNPTVTGSAYDRSFTGTTATQLYGIDTNLNILVRQANSAGTLNTVGPLGFDPPDVLGFDHTEASNVAYASWFAAGEDRLYSVNLTTGAATFLGIIGADNITDIALEIGYSEGLTAYGLTNDGRIATFSTANPNVVTNTATVTGLQIGETLEGIDLRPATGELYGFGATALGVSASLYRINPRTGVATFIAAYDQMVNGNDFALDFNPVPDRIRTVSDLDVNRRTHPTTGVTINDGTLAYNTGDPNQGANPNIVANGYENSFGGATTTRLFNIDSNLDILALQNPPNNGTLVTIGGLTWNTSADAGMDIIRGSNRAVAALNLIVGGNPQTRSELYEINVTTGAAAFIAPIGINAPIISLAVTSPTALNRFDYIGRGIANDRASFVTFRPNDNTWSFLFPDGNTLAFPYGIANTDFLTPGDFDGDTIMDVAVWRETNGVWYIQQSSDGAVRYVQWGQQGDEPVARDFDGDGKTDVAIVRRENGQMFWWIQSSATGGFSVQQFGLDTDFVAPGDYDGDGRFDTAVFREETNGQGTFYVNQSTAGFTAVQWGLGSDFVVPGDYDGDGKTDFAVVRQGSPYTWYILRSSDSGATIVEFGTKPHITVQNDYDGDGKTDIAVWDPTTAIFYVMQSRNGAVTQTQFGNIGDYPVANYDTH